MADKLLKLELSCVHKLAPLRINANYICLQYPVQSFSVWLMTSIGWEKRRSQPFDSAHLKVAFIWRPLKSNITPGISDPTLSSGILRIDTFYESFTFIASELLLPPSAIPPHTNVSPCRHDWCCQFRVAQLSLRVASCA